MIEAMKKAKQLINDILVLQFQNKCSNGAVIDAQNRRNLHGGTAAYCADVLQELSQAIEEAMEQEAVPGDYIFCPEYDDMNQCAVVGGAYIPANKLEIEHGLSCKLYTKLLPPQKPLSEEEILKAVPSGIIDCFNDPYGTDENPWYSIEKDIIRVAKAIEAAHGIGEKK